MDGFEFGFLYFHVVQITYSIDTVITMGVVSLELLHGLLVLLHVEVGVFAEIVVFTLLVAHV